MSVETIKKPENIIYDESKHEREGLSEEKLQTITNEEFLKITPEARLQNITKQQNKVENLKEKDIINFTFTFDGYFNKSLWSKTTAGQVLGPSIEEVSLDGDRYGRGGMKGEFFNSKGNRLVINEGTRLKIEKKRGTKEIQSISGKNKQIFDAYSKKNHENTDIIKGAIARNIDPDFAIKTFGGLIKELKGVDRKAKLEDLYTEFERIKGGFGSVISEGGKYNDVFIVTLLEKIDPNYERKTKELGVKEETIQAYKKSPHSAKYLSPTQKKEKLSRAPAYVKDLVKKYFPASEYENALLVCDGESSYNPKAINYNKDGRNSVDRGLFQINDYFHKNKYKGENIFDPEVNVRVAYEVFKESKQSWKPWYAARKIGLA